MMLIEKRENQEVLVRLSCREADIILTEQNFLTPEEASRYLRLSVDSVYNLLRKGDLAGKKVGQGWVIERSDLEFLLEAWGEREELPD